MEEKPSYDNEPFPEMLAVANIIDRVRDYISKHNKQIRMSLVMDFSSTNEGVAQNFIITAVPVNEPSDEEFSRVHKDCMAIIREEFEALSPDAIATITTPVASDVKMGDIDEELNKKFEEFKKLEEDDKQKPGSTFMGFD